MCPVPAISAIRAAIGNILFATKVGTPIAAIPGGDINLGAIDELTDFHLSADGLNDRHPAGGFFEPDNAVFQSK